MIILTIPRLPGMKYAVQIKIKYAGWGDVFSRAFAGWDEALRRAFLPWR